MCYQGVGGVGVCDAALVNLNSIKNNLVKDNFAIGGVLVNGFLSGFGANPVVNTSLQMWNSITDANMGPVGVFQCQVADILNPSQNPIQMTVKVLNGNQAEEAIQEPAYMTVMGSCTDCSRKEQKSKLLRRVFCHA